MRPFHSVLSTACLDHMYKVEEAVPTRARDGGAVLIDTSVEVPTKMMLTVATRRHSLCSDGRQTTSNSRISFYISADGSFFHSLARLMSIYSATYYLNARI